jgi:hypothetical protein
MTHDELEKLCTYLEENDASMEAQRAAAAELLRLHAINMDLLEALKYVLTDDGFVPRATSATRTVVRAAIAKATGETT